MSSYRSGLDFWECVECASKPGGPTLCESCYRNRDAIERLKAANRPLVQVQVKPEEMIDALILLAFFSAGLTCMAIWGLR
jgi:hypothetical protein